MSWKIKIFSIFSRNKNKNYLQKKIKLRELLGKLGRGFKEECKGLKVKRQNL